MATLDIQLKNNTTSNQVYASITGLALDRNNALFLLQSDGRTPYYPAQPGQDQAPLEQNCAIPLGSPGSTVTATVPHLAGSRIYFSIGAPLKFLLNRGGNGAAALVAPSINNPSDPNFNLQWAFCEFTFDYSQLFCNITYVDFVSLPIALSLTEQSGNTQNVTGFPPNGLDTIANDLRAQRGSDNQPWDSLIFAPNGSVLRILSPNNAILGNPSLFRGYYEPYVDQVWAKYTNEDLSIDTQIREWGTLNGRVNNNLLSFPNSQGQPYTFAKPSTADIFSCSSGPFALPNNEYGNLGARLAAGFNRSTLLTSDLLPDPSPADSYPGGVPTNHYSRILHVVNEDHLGYAFPYDDVTPSNGQDQSGKVASGSVQRFTVTLGGGLQTNEKTEL